jgi:hypothetical protein
MSLSILQFSGKMEAVTAFHFNTAQSTLSFIKNYVVYPYVSCFIGIKTYVYDTNRSKKPLIPAIPLKAKKACGKIFKQLFSLLNAIFINNRMSFLLIMIAFTVGRFLFKVKYFKEAFLRFKDFILPNYYLVWISKFLSLNEKFLRVRLNEYDIERITGLGDRKNRILENEFSKYGFFYVYRTNNCKYKKVVMYG